jgi:phage baseplate assembly protein V
LIDLPSRIRHLFGVGKVTRVDDSKRLTRLQVKQGKDGLIDDVPMVGLYGIASVPPLDSEILLLRLGGDRSQTFGVGSIHIESRLKDLQPGDVAIFDMRGAHIRLTAEGIHVDAAGLSITVDNADTVTVVAETKVRLDTPLVELTGDLTVDGDIKATGDVQSSDGDVSLDGLHDAYNAHAHGGVKAGDDTSDTTDHEA